MRRPAILRHHFEVSVDTSRVTRPRTGFAYLDAGLDQPGAVLAFAHRGGAFHPEIEGLVCYNDLVAVGALQACRELGRRVPDDVAVTGWDDIVLAELVSPSLTTLRVAKSTIGACAVQMLLDRIHGREAQAEVVFTPELVVRASAP